MPNGLNFTIEWRFISAVILKKQISIEYKVKIYKIA